jgi:hypothetical protein
MWDQADNTTWMQYTSKTPASRADVLAVEQALNQRLQQRQARLTGLCPVRADLHKQVFGEFRNGERARVGEEQNASQQRFSRILLPLFTRAHFLCR